MTALERFRQRMAAWDARAKRVRRGPVALVKKAPAIPAPKLARPPKPRRLRPTAEQRFWTKVRKGQPRECWLWTASENNEGYGRFRLNGKSRSAHVVSWLFAHGDTAGMCVLHKCDTPLCVNPAHLWLGTHADNMADMAAKGRAYRPSIATPTNAREAKR